MNIKDIKRPFKRIKRRLHAYSTGLLRANSQLPPNKFIIFGQGRTGSNLVQSLVNVHPDVRCDSEILLPGMIGKLLWPKLYINGCALKQHQSTYGFLLKLTHLPEGQGIDNIEFISYLTEQGWKIIYTQRRNFMKQIISAIIAINRHQWHDVSDNPLKDKKFYIDLEELFEGLRRKETQTATEMEILQNLPHLKIIYEDELLESQWHQQTADKIFEYLGVSSVSVQASLKKTTPKDLAQIVENYDEIVEAVSKTDYAHFLNQV